MPRGEKLIKFPASLMMRKFYGRAAIRFESGKVTHVEVEARRMWQYNDLPDRLSEWNDDLRLRYSHGSKCSSGEGCGP